MHEGKDILRSWQINAAEWIRVLDENLIPSREVTNQAIVHAILEYMPASVIDIGCGEGWLVRELTQRGIQSVGVDGTEELIKRAKSLKDGQFYVQSFEEIIKGKALRGAPFEAAIFNFCLYLKEEVELLFDAVKQHLQGDRLVFIQTLHPHAFINPGFTYKNQWLDNSWQGLKGEFNNPHGWYFRTLEGWIDTLANSGFILVKIIEPMLPDFSKLTSIIFVLSNDTGI